MNIKGCPLRLILTSLNLMPRKLQEPVYSLVCYFSMLRLNSRERKFTASPPDSRFPRVDTIAEIARHARRPTQNAKRVMGPTTIAG